MKTAIVMACAEGVVMHHDSNLPDINGGHITITKERQITAVFAATKAGNFLPIQAIYKGKTKEAYQT